MSNLIIYKINENVTDLNAVFGVLNKNPIEPRVRQTGENKIEVLTNKK